jgi:hypothetical protein
MFHSKLVRKSSEKERHWTIQGQSLREERPVPTLHQGDLLHCLLYVLLSQPTAMFHTWTAQITTFNQSQEF